MTVSVVVVELGCEIVAAGLDDDCTDPPPPQALRVAARTITPAPMAKRRRCGAKNPAATESRRSMLITPTGVIEAKPAACVVVRTSSVVETVALPLAFSVAGENEHCAVAGSPLQEKDTEPENPFCGVTFRSTDAGCPD